MKASEIATSLEWLTLANKPAHIIGSPGVGKTSVVYQVNNKLKRDVLVTRVGELETVDARGIPVADLKTGTTRWLPPAEFPRIDKPITWFFDEYAQGLPSVQAVFGRLFNERKLGEYVLPDHVYLTAASNRAKDRAATNRTPSHINSRMFLLPFEADLGDWCKYAFDNDVETEVIAFNRWKGDSLDQFDPNKDASPTPRAWVDCSDALKAMRKHKLNIPQSVEEKVYAGKLGDGMAIEFMGFLPLVRSLPDPDQMLRDPDRCDLPKLDQKNGPAIYAALSTSLSRKATEANFDRVVKIANRMPRQFGALLILLATGRDKELLSTSAFIEYADKNQSLFT